MLTKLEYKQMSKYTHTHTTDRGIIHSIKYSNHSNLFPKGEFPTRVFQPFRVYPGIDAKNIFTYNNTKNKNDTRFFLCYVAALWRGIEMTKKKKKKGNSAGVSAFQIRAGIFGGVATDHCCFSHVASYQLFFPPRLPHEPNPIFFPL